MPEIPPKLMEQIARLSPETRALLELKLMVRQRSIAAGDGPVQVPDQAPLTFAQQRFWFFEQFEPEIPVYNEWTAVCLRGPLNVEALEHAIQALMNRHFALRTTVVVHNGQP